MRSSWGMTKQVLVLDVGGTNLKVFPASGKEPTIIPSGPHFTPQAMVSVAKKIAARWPHDAVSIGIPAVLLNGEVVAEPPNLGRGWVGFDYGKALGKPVRLINDAAMQALGSYEGGTMLFLGLGTGLGSALVVDGKVIPLELSQLPFRRGTYEDYLGLRGYRRFGGKRWRAMATAAAVRFKEGLVADYVVLGGGRVHVLTTLPPGCRRGDNSHAFEGGQRLWRR